VATVLGGQVRRSTGLVLLLFLVLGCRQEAATRAAGPAIASDETPQQGGTLVRRLDGDVTSLNPIIGNSSYELDVTRMLFTPLLQLDQNLDLIPGLVDKWDISGDGRLYTFHLNAQATFEDGVAVRASDVLFTLRKIVDPTSEAPQLAATFEGIDWTRTAAVDDHTVNVAFKEPRAGQLYAFVLDVLPEHVYSKGDFKTGWASRAVGNGPYRLLRRVPDKEILLERREDYWGTKPYLRRILFKIVVDDNTAWNAMKRGELDETLVTSDQWQLEGGSPQVQRVMDIRRFYTLSYNCIPWNNRDPILSDRRVRRALAMCLDRKSIIANIFHGTARVMTGPFTPDQWAYNPNVPSIEYDPEGALKLFQQAGWGDSDGDGVLDKEGKPLEIEMLVAAGKSGTVPLVEVYQSELKQIGVRLKVVSVDPAVMIQRILKGDYQAAYMGWDVDPDPGGILFPMFHSSQFPPAGQNIVFYSNPEVDQLIIAGRDEMNRSKRMAIYQHLHEVLAADQPYFWAVQVSAKWAVNRRIHNVRESRGNGLFNWYPGPLEWWIPAEQQRPRERRQDAGATGR
jgi:peptide/nickel transport system substrate-binding protein